MINPTKAKGMLLLAFLSLPYQLHAAPPQFEIDLKELDRQKPAPAPKPTKQELPAKKHAPTKKKAPEETPRPAKGAASSAAEGDYARYTVKPGDHIHKILMVNFGMSNEAAERLVPEIVRINGIGNIKALTVGRTLLIPVSGKQAQSRHHHRKERHKEKPRTVTAPEAQGSSSHEKAPAAPPTAAAQEPEAAPRAPEPAPQAPEAAPRAPEPAPTPRAAEPAPAAPAAKPAPAPAEKAPTPAPAAPAAPSVPAPPAAAQATTWVCAVPKQNTAAIVDSLLNVISVSWTKNKIIHSGSGAPTTFSIRVDRYFEYKGARYIISIGENDPYNYTLIRLLEAAGYRVLMLSGSEDFKTTSEKLFKLVGVEAPLGTHALPGGAQATGYLLQQEDAGGRRVLMTEGTPPPGHKWVLPPGCASK